MQQFRIDWVVRYRCLVRVCHKRAMQRSRPVMKWRGGTKLTRNRVFEQSSSAWHLQKMAKHYSDMYDSRKWRSEKKQRKKVAHEANKLNSHGGLLSITHATNEREAKKSECKLPSEKRLRKKGVALTHANLRKTPFLRIDDKK